MISRLIWWGSILAVAAVAIFAQLDRASRFEPRYAAYVPNVFSGFAAQQRTRQAIAQMDAETALEQARILLKARPLPAEHVTMWAQALALSGDADAAIAALDASSLRGWREPVAQRAMAEAALATDNRTVAVQRIAALLATGTLEAEEMQGLVQRLAQSPEGREALAEAMAAQGYWQQSLTRHASASLTPQQFDDLMMRAARHTAQ